MVRSLGTSIEGLTGRGTAILCSRTADFGVLLVLSDSRGTQMQSMSHALRFIPGKFISECCSAVERGATLGSELSESRDI